ncbi:hypothetical protein Tco_0409180 [Tanacetum coccineum]
MVIRNGVMVFGKMEWSWQYCGDGGGIQISWQSLYGVRRWGQSRSEIVCIFILISLLLHLNLSAEGNQMDLSPGSLSVSPLAPPSGCRLRNTYPGGYACRVNRLRKNV